MPAGSGSGADPDLADGDAGAAAWFVRRVGLARWTTVAGASGLALAAAFPTGWRVAISGLACALSGILAGYLFSRLRPRSGGALMVTIVSVLLVGLFSGLLVGVLRVSALMDGGLCSRYGERVQAEVVVTGPVRSNAGWQSATGYVRRISEEGGARPVLSDGAEVGEKILLEVAPERSRHQAQSGQAAGSGRTVSAEITQGAILAVSGTLQPPEGPSSTGFDQSKQLLHQGIRVVLEAEPDSLSLLARRGGVSGWFDRLRTSAKQHLSLGPDSRINEVLQGVVMGDTDGIDKGWMDAFRRSGTAHMLSVSGLHVASLAAIMIALAGFARLSRRAGFLLAAMAALLMVPFVGSSPPIVRSAAMIVVVLAGRWVGRRRDAWQGLAFAAVVVLGLNPYAIFDVGFQLSFCAFVGMLALVRPFERLFQSLPDSVRANLAVSLAATLGTAPVSLLAFGRTSLISPVANLMVVPTLAAVTGLGMASVLLGFVWSGFSVALDALASVPMAWTIIISTLCARVPVLAAGDLGRAGLALTLAAAALPAALALCGRTVAIPFGLSLPFFQRGTSWLCSHRPRDRRYRVAAAVAAVLVALMLGAATYPAAAGGVRSFQLALAARGWPSEVEVRVLDVGQGTAVLVRTPQHHAALFDGGPAGCDLAEQLRALGVKRLDLVVISHPHADHFAGLLESLDSVRVRTFLDRTEVDPPTGPPSVAASGGEAGEYLQLRKRLAATGCRFLEVTSGSSLSLDGVGAAFFAPLRRLVLVDSSEPWGAGREPPSGDELNGGSIVTILTIGRASVLLPGDAEADVLRGYDLPQFSALVVPHHGSRDAVSQPLLAALQGRLALISVGKGNTFGHPDQGTLSMLAAAADSVIRTDERGWVSLRLDDDHMTVSSERKAADDRSSGRNQP